MTEKKDYRILVTEIRQKSMTVRAATEQEAQRRAEDAWKNAEVILGTEDFQGVEFHILGEADGTEGDKHVCRIEEKDV